MIDKLIVEPVFCLRLMTNISFILTNMRLSSHIPIEKRKTRNKTYFLEGGPPLSRALRLFNNFFSGRTG